jgi:hypothetical protein
MKKTIIHFVMISLGLQFHEVSAGDLGVQRWSNRFNPATGTLALEPQKTPAPAHEVAVKECYWTTGPRGEPVFVHNPSLQHQSARSTHTSSPTDSGYSSGDEGGASRPDDQTLKTQKTLKPSAKNHRKELYWGTDSRGKLILIREENSPDEPPVLIKHKIISCKGDDCEEDFQNDRGSEHKDFVLNDAAEIPSEDSPEEPGDLEETTSDAESDHFSENDSQERGHWSPDGDSETPGEQNAAEENDPSETSESLNGESDEETSQSEPKKRVGHVPPPSGGSIPKPKAEQTDASGSLMEEIIGSKTIPQIDPTEPSVGDIATPPPGGSAKRAPAIAPPCKPTASASAHVPPPPPPPPPPSEVSIPKYKAKQRDASGSLMEEIPNPENGDKAQKPEYLKKIDASLREELEKPKKALYGDDCDDQDEDSPPIKRDNVPPSPQPRSGGSPVDRRTPPASGSDHVSLAPPPPPIDLLESIRAGVTLKKTPDLKNANNASKPKEMNDVLKDRLENFVFGNSNDSQEEDSDSEEKFDWNEDCDSAVKGKNFQKTRETQQFGIHIIVKHPGQQRDQGKDSSQGEYKNQSKDDSQVQYNYLLSKDFLDKRRSAYYSDDEDNSSDDEGKDNQSNSHEKNGGNEAGPTPCSEEPTDGYQDDSDNSGGGVDSGGADGDNSGDGNEYARGATDDQGRPDGYQDDSDNSGGGVDNGGADGDNSGDGNEYARGATDDQGRPDGYQDDSDNSGGGVDNGGADGDNSGDRNEYALGAPDVPESPDGYMSEDIHDIPDYSESFESMFRDGAENTSTNDGDNGVKTD